MSINAIELRHLRYFVAVAEERNFRKASERLNIAQPPLSRAIKQLEYLVGHQLLIRSTRRVQLTEPGHRFLDGCYATLNEMKRTISDTQVAALGFTGSIRLGYTDLAISGKLPELLTGFRNQYPDMILKPYHGVTNQQLRLLTSGQLDVGFVTGPLEFDGLETLLVQRERFVCVVYADHPLAGHESISLRKLANQSFVHGPSKDWEQFHTQLFPLCSKAGFLPNVVQEAFNSAAILSLVAGGMGVTILSEGTARSALPGLVTVEINDVEATVDTYAIWQADDNTTPTKTFREYLRANFCT